MMRRAWLQNRIAMIAVSAICFTLSLLLFRVPVVYAEETPIKVPLTFVSSISNTGPTTATGIAYVWQIDFEVRVSVQGLPILQNQLYEAWLVNQQTGQYLSVGRFNVGTNGSATIDVSFPGHMPAGYSMVLVTVQPDPDPNKSQPTGARSIAGFFQGNSAIQNQVQHLPDTGINAQHPPFEPRWAYDPSAPKPATTPTPAQPLNGVSLALLMIGVISLGFVLRRTSRRHR